jgi:uncharacterized protein (TIGR03000 family)
MFHRHYHLLASPLAVLLTAGVASAQHGGHGGGHAGGGHVGGGHVSGYHGGVYRGGYGGFSSGGFGSPYRYGYGTSPYALRSFYGGGAPIAHYPYRGFGYPGFGYPIGGIGYASPYLGFGYGGLGYGYGGFGYGGFGYGRFALGGYTYAAPPIAAVVGYPAISPQLLDEPPAQPDASASAFSRPANVTVTVPDGAEVTFEGNVNSETGATRHYTSPALEPGYDYALNVKVTPPGGATRAVRLTVRAGDNVSVDLSK